MELTHKDLLYVASFFRDWPELGDFLTTVLPGFDQDVDWLEDEVYAIDNIEAAAWIWYRLEDELPSDFLETVCRHVVNEMRSDGLYDVSDWEFQSIWSIEGGYNLSR